MSSPDGKLHRVLIVDDDRLFLQTLEKNIREDFPGLQVTACDNPVQALKAIDETIDLLLLDLEMPGMDGSKLLAYATARGIDKSRIIILSGKDAEHLHQIFPMGVCLAVLNKHEARQKTVLKMVFSSLEKK